MTDALARLAADLRRPGGGWTVGFATLFGPIGVLLAAEVGLWPGPAWTAAPVAVGTFAIHLGWGLHGYYPNRI